MTARADPYVYRGSVKDIRLVRQPVRRKPGRYIFEFTDDYSVFDYGKMPDTIRDKGSAIAMLTACLFELLEDASAWRKLLRNSQLWDGLGGSATRDRLRKSPAGKRLQQHGLATHYLGVLDARGRCRRFSELREPSRRLLVRAVPVVRPETVRVDGATVWNYNGLNPDRPLFLIPLENVFRFGVPRGSSLLERIQKDPGYARQLGLQGAPREGEWLPRPVLEFFTKLEPMDRHLGPEAAVNFSGLDGPGFLELRDLCLLVAVFLFELFREKGLDLWDGKLEFVKVNESLLLADSITPDELRLTWRGGQISKEPLRQYYKKNDAAFVEAMKSLKEEGGAAGSVTKAVAGRLGRPPRKLDPGFRRTVEDMYRVLSNRVTGRELFPGGFDLDAVLQGLAGV